MNTTSREKIFLYVGGVLFGFAVIYLLIVKPVYRKHLEIQDKIEQKGFKASFKLEDGIKELVNLYSKPNFVASKNC